MTIQWAYTMLRWRNVESLEEAKEFMAEILPTRVVASSVNKTLVVHDLEKISHDRDMYVAFGMCERRCPGEYLTYAFLLTCRGKSTAEPSEEFLGLNKLNFQ